MDEQFTKKQLYAMKVEDLKVLAEKKGITLSGKEKEKDLVDAIFNKQNEARLQGTADTAAKLDAALGGDGLKEGEAAGNAGAGETAGDQKTITLTEEALLQLKSEIATDVFNALIANFEENNKAHLDKAKGVFERLDTLEGRVASVEQKIVNAGTLHGSIDGLKAPY